MNTANRHMAICCTLSVLLILTGCSIFKTVELSPKYSKVRYQRVGLLVTRMGGRTFSSVSWITPQTNYANREFRPQSATGLSEDFVDVYIEDDVRLRQAIPSYPKYESPFGANIGGLRKDESQYYANISPELYKGVKKLYESKGYTIVDVRELSRNWDKPISEMSIAEISNRLRGTVDALAVLHYMDVGSSYLYAVTVEKRTIGFSFLAYTLAMFDTETSERLLSFRPLFPLGVTSALSLDPKVVDNPELKSRVRSSSQEEIGYLKKTTHTEFSTTLTHDEIVKLVVGYVTTGIKVSGDTPEKCIDWQGLNQIIPD